MRRKGKGTELRDQIAKSEARKLAHKNFVENYKARMPGINTTAVRIEPITRDAINACHLWMPPVIYPWDCVPDWKRKDAKGLDLAIWYEHKLYGLCYATPRRSTICMKIVLLQGHPDRSHPLRGWIAPLALLATDTYARMLGCNEIVIQDPDPYVVPYYQGLGFRFDRTNRLVIYLDEN